MGCGGLSSAYLSTLSLGGATRIEYRPWEVESALCVVTGGGCSAVVVVVAAARFACSKGSSRYNRPVRSVGVADKALTTRAEAVTGRAWLKKPRHCRLRCHPALIPEIAFA